ncbi:hypothetical protein FOZ62_024692 [Perkinsus olseni]|uniref:Uncharacterized protein n=1 Tax=Perkinsus olseni TaxID=32597 RepID=A0A7J6N9Q6_PEROL|nr:hypothetical protein FOZ62_024692 [Perkinsus olseni]
MLITSLSPFAEVAAQAAQNDVAITGCEPSDFHTDTQFTELSIGTHVEGSACCNAEVNDSQTTVDGCCWRCIDSRGLANATFPPRPSSSSFSPVLINNSSVIDFLNHQQPNGLGVVLGVGEGHFVKKLLTEWKDSAGVYLVDPYIHVWKGYDDPDNNLNDRDHQLRFEQLRNDLHYSPSIPDWKYAFMRDFSFSLAPWWQTKDLPRPTFM